MIIQKFGGSSLADLTCIHRSAKIIAEAKKRDENVLAVLSARGGTTDLLIEDAKKLSENPPLREMDVLLSTGELSSVALMAMELSSMGYNCVSLSGRQAGIYTDSNHGSAEIVSVNTRRIIRELQQGKIVLVAGFQGVSAEDNITTLGRGGSDTTAVALAAALGAEHCEIYSDVDGIYTADPRLVPNAKKLDILSRQDMLLLAKGGSQVLHSRSVEEAIKRNVDVLCLSSFKKGEGTLVSECGSSRALTGITRDKKLNKITVVGKGADHGCLVSAVGIMCEAGMTVSEAHTGDGYCSIVTEAEFVLPALRLIHAYFFE